MPLEVARGAAKVVQRVYAGTIAIGGRIERGDIHTAMQQNPAFDELGVGTLNPDEFAETVWRLYTERDRAEVVVNALAV